MRLGDIDRESRQYVLRDPRTPVKWINYIGTREFGGFVDHTGGALICRDDPTFNRITRYIFQLPSSDLPILWERVQFYPLPPEKASAEPSHAVSIGLDLTYMWVP